MTVPPDEIFNFWRPELLLEGEDLLALTAEPPPLRLMHDHRVRDLDLTVLCEAVDGLRRLSVDPQRRWHVENCRARLAYILEPQSAQVSFYQPPAVSYPITVGETPEWRLAVVLTLTLADHEWTHVIADGEAGLGQLNST